MSLEIVADSCRASAPVEASLYVTATLQDSEQRKTKDSNEATKETPNEGPKRRVKTPCKLPATIAIFDVPLTPLDLRRK